VVPFCMGFVWNFHQVSNCGEVTFNQFDQQIDTDFDISDILIVTIVFVISNVITGPGISPGYVDMDI